MLAELRPIGTIAVASAFLALGLGIGVPSNTAFAVDCLTAPNSPAPPNGHWYYRTDRTQERKCWHLQGNDASEPAAVQNAREAPVKPSQSVAAGDSYSGPAFKDFVAQHGGAKPSHEEIERLYAEFLEWQRRR